MKRNIITIVATLIFALIAYYFVLPPINLSSPLFYTYALMILIFFVIVRFFATIESFIRRGRIYLDNKVLNHNLFMKTKDKNFGVIGIFGLIFIINFILSPLFNAKSYSERISVATNSEFVSDVKPVDFTKTPLIDKESSQKLGDRKMGEFTSWVSQFYVSDVYTQINYNNDIVRVTPLEYADIIKYFTNRKDGIKGYIMVNSVTGSASLEEIPKGMRYMPSALFFENLDRHLRLQYPMTIFDEASFEVDNEGHPYWIVPTVKYIGVGLKKEITGVVILDPITGESNKYKVEDVPTWVDHVYSADLIIEQVDNWGEYRNGFFNSLFGQRDVINTTAGYNYLVMDDDVYLYTGITSVSSDESNLGFVLVNLRTKETNYYLAPGAEEFSAMASAEGLVQEKGYDASFPLLINLNNKPTYLLSLKDNAGLVKMYAFIDVEDYQKVVVSDASLGIEAAAEKYLGDGAPLLEKASNVISHNEMILENHLAIGNFGGYPSITIPCGFIDNLPIGVNIVIDSNNDLYVANVTVDRYRLPYLNSDDKIKVDYSDNESHKDITKIY